MYGVIERRRQYLHLMRQVTLEQGYFTVTNYTEGGGSAEEHGPGLGQPPCLRRVCGGEGTEAGPYPCPVCSGQRGPLLCMPEDFYHGGR